MTDFDLDAALERAIAEPRTRRAEVLRAAESLFAKRGFAAVRIRDVAQLAAVNSATVHLHWKSKAILYEAVCRLHAKQLLRFVDGAGLSTGDRPMADAIGDMIEFLASHPHIAPLALQSVADQSPPELPSLFSHDVSAFRFVEKAVRDRSPDDAEAVEPILTVLTVFYFAAVAFCDSPLQRALLGGSVYHDAEVRGRVAHFASSLASRLVDAS